MRRLAIVCGLSFLGVALLGLLLGAPVAHADTTVGNGTPQSCTEQQLDLALAGGGSINFNCGPAPITLTVGQKVISSVIEIDGGGLVSLSGGDLNRVFSVTVDGSLYLNNLRVTHGAGGPFEHGGAIYSAGFLQLQNSQVVHSVCHLQCLGAAIASLNLLVMFDSQVSGNQADSGGAITLITGTAAIYSSTISNNSGPGGAGLINLGTGGPTLIRDSSIINNSASSNGGGIVNDTGATLLLVNSTVSGNTANLNGGGLANAGTLLLYNATVTNNYADKDLDGNGTGGGVYNTGSGDFQFWNTILAGNNESFHSPTFGWVEHYGDCAGTLTSNGFNLIQNYNTSNCTINGPFTLTAPLLGPLFFNGGPTLTHRPLAGSPAIDAGNPTGCIDNAAQPLTHDQRGFLRINGCDIGALERGFELDLALVRR